MELKFLTIHLSNTDMIRVTSVVSFYLCVDSNLVWTINNHGLGDNVLIFFTTVAAECPESGSCEACDLIMSISLESVNNEIMVIKQDEITFTLNFQQRGHNGFSFGVNNKLFNPNVRNPDFPCTSEGDTPNVTQTLEIQYHCIAVKPGSYRINAHVYYCHKDYFAQNFTVIVENDLPAPSASVPSSLSSASASISSPVPSMSSSLIPPPVSPTRSSVPSSSTIMPITPSASSSRILPSTSTSVSPSLTTENDGNNSVIIAVITCVFTGLLLIAVVTIILLKCGIIRPNNVFCCWSEQPAPDPQRAQDPPGDYPLQQIQYRCTSAVSETSNEASGSYVAPSDFSTPVDSVSVSFVHPEQVVMSENVTREPEEAITSHQLGTNHYTD